MPSFRQRLEHSPLLAGFVARLVGAYLALCQRTIRWQVEGVEELCADTDEGPVLVVMWHARSLMGPLHWPAKAGPLSSLAAKSPIGRASAALQRQHGMQPMIMSENASNMAASRVVLKRVRAGVSIGMTGDGPLGPAFTMKDAPLDWARIMQRPVYGFAYGTSRGRALSTWDRMWLPHPFGRGRVIFRKWPVQPARHAPSSDYHTALATFLDEVSSDADDLG